MKKKNAGFTLVEMIIVIALTAVVVSIAGSIMIKGNEVFSDTNVKSDLQIEGQTIHERLSNMSMGTSDIKEVKLKSGNIINFEDIDDKNSLIDSFKDWSSIEEIVLNVADIDDSNNNNNNDNSNDITVKKDKYKYTFKIDGNKFVMVKQKEGNSEDEAGSQESILSTNAKDFKFKLNSNCNTDNNGNSKNNANDTDNTEDADNTIYTGAEFEIDLAKKKGLTSKEYPIKVGVLFRNNDITEDVVSNT